VCVLPHSLHTRLSGASGARHSLRPPIGGRDSLSKPRAYPAARSRNCVCCCLKIESVFRRNHESGAAAGWLERSESPATLQSIAKLSMWPPSRTGLLDGLLRTEYRACRPQIPLRHHTMRTASIVIVRPSTARVHVQSSARCKTYSASRIRFGGAFLHQTCEADIRYHQADPRPFRGRNVRHFRSEESA
jgi:hypothetical protein